MKTRVNLGQNEIFFNGGMQLMNLKKFREDNLENKFLTKLRESTYYTDQDVVNDICRGKILRLHIKYNIMPVDGYQEDGDEFLEAFRNPVLIHYTVKPWKNRNVLWYEAWNLYHEMNKGLMKIKTNNSI